VLVAGSYKKPEKHGDAATFRGGNVGGAACSCRWCCLSGSEAELLCVNFVVSIKFFGPLLCLALSLPLRVLPTQLLYTGVGRLRSG
jgi:hypothetical protein